MADTPRIAELRRRVETDPASIAFAQLAEEYRREGFYDEAVQACRAGLERYPGYLSARMTLVRALTELGRYDEADSELRRVLDVAPDNVAAQRALDDLRQRQRSAQPVPPSPDIPTPDPALHQLEAWLAAILADRAARVHR